MGHMSSIYCVVCRQPKYLVWYAGEGTSPVGAPWHMGTPGHMEYHGVDCGKIGEPPSKPNYTCVIDSEEYREGKVKKYPGRGVKSS